MAVKLHRCSQQWVKLKGHPCWKVEKALMVTCYGGFLVGQAAARQMLERGHGSILFTGASASEFGEPEIPQSRGARLLLQIVHERRGFALDSHVLDPGAVARKHLPVEERLQPFSPLYGPWRQIEIH